MKQPSMQFEIGNFAMKLLEGNHGNLLPESKLSQSIDLTCKYSNPGVDTLYDGLYVDAAERSTTYVPLS